MVITQ